MNIVDYVILGIVGISILFGLYRGFISSVLNTGGCLLSFGLSFYFTPKLASVVQGNVSLQETLSHYTDISSRLGDLDLALTNVRDLGLEKITEIISRVDLPQPLAALLESNLVNQVYAGEASVQTVQDYLSQTILTACINILCFLVCFLVCYLVIALVVNLLKAIFRFPVLKQLDGLAGGAFGLLRGALLCYVLIALVPLVQTMVPIDMVTDLVAESTFAPFFNNGNLILAIINGKL